MYVYTHMPCLHIIHHIQMSRASGLKTRKSRNLWHLPKNRPSKQNSLGMAACQEIGHGRHIERWEVGDEMFQSIQMTSLDMVNICKNLHIVIILMIMTIISINTSLSIIIQCFFCFVSFQSQYWIDEDGRSMWFGLYGLQQSAMSYGIKLRDSWEPLAL